ncbi:hypothetical protein HI920_07315 [Enterococcus faecalis]|uniref:hypothetical protein n=1 Tax=Enterococcus faecalis TaxID=1351 RepID=UPI00145C304E|nr:hypothetical protein [Enterococcus faecalis]NMP45964.1 hypothetical protein [Enterococcus faecalis]
MKIKTKKYNVEVNHVHVNQKNNLFGTLKITSINPAFVSDTKNLQKIILFAAHVIVALQTYAPNF